MRILIVGAGYVGGAFGKAAKERGHHVIVASRTLEKIPEYLKWANEAFLWQKVVPDTIDGVLLSVAPRGQSYEEAYLENANALISAPYIVYTSSTSVYGDHQGRTVNEMTEPLPQTPNQKVLFETEKILPPYKSAIFRLGEITGPERNRPLPETVPGNGDSICNFSPISLIVEALISAFERRKIGLFNLVSNYHPIRREYYAEIAKSQGLKPPLFNSGQTSPHAGNKRVTSIYQ